MSKRMITVGVLILVAGVAAWWFFLRKEGLPEGFAAGNGRLEATDVYVATKYSGRVKEVLFDEGDTVHWQKIPILWHERKNLARRLHPRFPTLLQVTLYAQVHIRESSGRGPGGFHAVLRSHRLRHEPAIQR